MIINFINILKSSLSKITDLPESEIKVDVPQNPGFGDYSTNIALTLQGSPLQGGGKNPRELAEEIVGKINNSELIINNLLVKVEVAGPGFINFYLSKDMLFDILRNILIYKDTFGQNGNLKNKKIVVEFTDPNPFKEFHVGHLYSNTVGESISRLLEAAGAHVWRADYFGDVGMHVAKAIWGLIKKFEEDNLSIKKMKGRTLGSRIEYFGQAYAIGATEYEEGNETSKEEMKALNFLIFKAAQEVVLPEFKEKPKVNYDQYIKKSKFDYKEIKEIYNIGRAWSLEYFEMIYKRLGMNFNGYYPESRTGEFGYGMVLEGLKKGIFEKGEGGAIIFPGQKDGLHNRVFINSMKLPTYETKDFGNSVAKHKDFAYDKSIIVTGNEINEYFHVVLKALTLYKRELGENTKHIGHGMVRLPEGKMSSRTGKIIRGEWVLDEAKKRTKTIIDSNKKDSELSENEKSEIAEIVAQGAIKYAFLKQGIGENISFDFNSSLSFEGNSGPYLQYTYARTRSVLGKAGSLKYDDYIRSQENPAFQVGDELSSDMSSSFRGNPALLTLGGRHNNYKNYIEANSEELSLLRALVHFPEVVEEAAGTFNPSLVCTYLYDLAQKFNTFYARHKILDAQSKRVKEQESKSVKLFSGQAVQQFRLSLTSATGQVLKNGLKLLGILAPSRM